MPDALIPLSDADVAYYLRHGDLCGGRKISAFLVNLWMRDIAHANDLVEMLGAPYTVDGVRYPGAMDNVALAERVLHALERGGWIARGAFEPTREQAFFGVGGFTGRAVGKSGSILTHALTPRRDCAAFAAYVRERTRKESA